MDADSTQITTLSKTRMFKEVFFVFFYIIDHHSVLDYVQSVFPIAVQFGHCQAPPSVLHSLQPSITQSTHQRQVMRYSSRLRQNAMWKYFLLRDRHNKDLWNDPVLTWCCKCCTFDSRQIRWQRQNHHTWLSFLCQNHIK